MSQMQTLSLAGHAAMNSNAWTIITPVSIGVLPAMIHLVSITWMLRNAPVIGLLFCFGRPSFFLDRQSTLLAKLISDGLL